MKRDDGYSRPVGGDTDKDAANKGLGQKPGGNRDDTPGQVGKGNVSAAVLLSNPSRLDSMGGSESRGRDNCKR